MKKKIFILPVLILTLSSSCKTWSLQETTDNPPVSGVPKAVAETTEKGTMVYDPKQLFGNSEGEFLKLATAAQDVAKTYVSNNPQAKDSTFYLVTDNLAKNDTTELAAKLASPAPQELEGKTTKKKDDSKTALFAAGISLLGVGGLSLLASLACLAKKIYMRTNHALDVGVRPIQAFGAAVIKTEQSEFHHVIGGSADVGKMAKDAIATKKHIAALTGSSIATVMGTVLTEMANQDLVTSPEERTLAQLDAIAKKATKLRNKSPYQRNLSLTGLSCFRSNVADEPLKFEESRQPSS